MTRARAARVIRYAQRAIAAGVAIELIWRAVEDMLNRVGDSTLTEEQRQEAEERFRQELESLQEVTVNQTRQYGVDERGLGGPIRVNTQTRRGGMGPPTWEQLPPGARSPRSRPTEEVTSVGRRPRDSLLRNASIFGLGLAGIQLLRSSRTSASSPPVAVNIPPITIPGPMPQPQPLTLVQGGMLGSTPTATRTCECKDTKRKKRRKCLERAQVEWRSGRYKGKLAGTKCVRFSSE